MPASEERSLLQNTLETVRLDVKLALFSLIANIVAGSPLVPRLVRIPLLRLAGIDVRRAHVWPSVTFLDPKVRIGDRVTINRGCLFDAYGGVTIGDRVHVGFQVSFITTDHEVGPPTHRCGPHKTAPIVVEDGAWIGARSTILPGVTVGRGCVVAVGAVVREDCAPNGLYAGVPARRVRDLPV